MPQECHNLAHSLNDSSPLDFPSTLGVGICLLRRLTVTLQMPPDFVYPPLDYEFLVDKNHNLFISESPTPSMLLDT